MELDLYFKAASALIDKLRDKLHGSTKKDKQAVRLLAAMMLSVLHVLKRSSKTEAKDATSKLYDLMQGWIGNFNVIGGPSLGGKLSTKRKQEIKVM